MLVILGSIGKLLLLLFIIAAALAVLVLFLPVRYELDADIDKKYVSFRVRWMFRLIRFRFRFQEKMEAVLQLAFFRIDFMDPKTQAKMKARKQAKEKKKIEKQRRKQKKLLAKREKELEKQRKAYYKEKEKEKAKYMEDHPDEALVSEDSQKADSFHSEGDSSTEAEADDAEKSNGLGEKLRKLRDTLVKVKNLAVNMKRIMENASRYQLLCIVLPKLQRFLHRIRPRVLRGQIEFGLEDPSNTGKIVGAITMVPIFYESELIFIPDFESDKNYIHGQVYSRGYVMLIDVLILGIGLITEKNVRRFIGSMRKKKS